MKGWIIFIAMAAAAVSVPSLAQDPPGKDPAQGRRLYMATGCWQCHGTVGQGGGWQGPKLAPGALPLEAFTELVRNPVLTMPPYREAVISDRDLADIHAYLESIQPSRPADQIEVLSRR